MERRSPWLDTVPGRAISSSVTLEKYRSGATRTMTLGKGNSGEVSSFPCTIYTIKVLFAFARQLAVSSTGGLQAIANHGGAMRTKHRLGGVLIAALLLAPPSLSAQQVTGRIVDQSTGQPIASVQVSIPGTGLGALTQQSGRYLLLTVPVGSHTVNAQRIGYKTVTAQVTVTAGATVVQDFTLTEEALGLDEIVVTGVAGGGRQREVGAAVSRLGGSDLSSMARGDLGAALGGRAAGLTMSVGSPQPGAAGRITLRGSNSISVSDHPLIYVDGVRIFSGAANTSPTSASQQYDPLSNIRPQDIERVEVVRGPAATTLYGTEASGGVIQIFTKRGATGAPQWSAEMTGGAHTMGHVGPSASTGNIDGLGYNQCIDRVTSKGVVFSDVTCPADGDWMKLGKVQRYNLGVTGGTAGFTYAVSTNYRYEDSPFDGSMVDVDQVGYASDGGVRANFTVQILPSLSAQWTTSVNGGTIRWVPEGATGTTSWSMSMTRGPQGAIFLDGKPATGLAFKQQSFDKRKQATTGLTLQHKLGEHFDQRVAVGYDVNQNTASSYSPVGHWNTPLGDYVEVEWSHWTASFDYGANYKMSFRGGDITSATSGGFQAAQDVDKRVQFKSQDFPAPVEVPTLTYGAVRNIVNDDRRRVINAGYYVQQMIGYKDRLFVTAGMRMDGNSTFGDSYGMQVYPKLSASYILSDMDFWPEWAESFKLRAAVGEAGKAPGAFDAVRSWAPIAADEGKPAFTPSTVGDPNLGPERTREYEVGFDAALFQGRVTTEVNVFRQRTLDALVPVTPIPSLGFSAAQLSNIGTLENNGFEVTVDAGVIRGAWFNWDVGGSYSVSKPKAVDLGGRVISLNANGVQVREGYPVPSMFGWKVTNPDEFAAPIIEKDVFIGAAWADRTINLRSNVGLLNSSLRLGAVGEFQLGGTVINQTSRLTAQRDMFGPCYAAQQAQRKNQAGDGSAWATIPALLRIKCTVVPTEQRLELWMENIDFFKLRTVTLSYDLPDGLIPGTQAATLNFAGVNLFKRTDYWGTDPEALNNASTLPAGRDYNQLPPYTTYTASLSIRF